MLSASYQHHGLATVEVVIHLVALPCVKNPTLRPPLLRFLFNIFYRSFKEAGSGLDRTPPPVVKVVL